ncbi:MAG TPA: hypothetical protein VHX88_14900 [Solirubrobacteraceae bacterium]|jgi:hypothetical protein|nr:hypothetical protein [Solirubrobacteraceae bacterium]
MSAPTMDAERWQRLRCPAQAPDGKALELSVCLPPGWRALDTLRSRPGEDGPPPALLDAAAAGGVITVQSLYAPRREELIAIGSLTVALTDLAGAPVTTGRDGQARRVRLPLGEGVRVRQVREVATEPGRAPLTVTTVGYRVQCAYGALALTFATTLREISAALARRLDEIAAALALQAA